METIFPPFPTFSLPRHAWLGMCEGLLARSVSGTSTVLSYAGTGHSGRPGAQAVPESLGWLLSSLLSLPTPLGHGRSVSGYLLGGVCVSVCLCGCSLHCLFSLGWIKTVNS